MKTALYAVAAVALVGLAACNQGSKHEGGGDTAPVSTQPPASTPPPPTVAPPCRSGDLGLVKVGEDAGAGQRAVTYAFVNNGPAACLLQGYPTVVLFDANGQRLDDITIVQSEQDYFNTGGAPQPVTVQPKGRAVFFTSFTGIQATDKPCEAVARLQVTPPGNSQAIEVQDSLSVCTGQMRLSPVRAKAPSAGGATKAVNTKNNNPNSTVFY